MQTATIDAATSSAPLSLDEAIRTRRALRHFSSTPIPRETLLELLELAHRAPSSYNLQPWHFVVVDDPETKRRLRAAALDQAQVEEAPCVVAVVVDPDAAMTQREAVIAQGLQAGSITEEYAERIRSITSLAFGMGPLGLGGLLKAVAFALGRLFRPIPYLPSTRLGLRHYWEGEALLAADHLMLAARSRGLDTCPMRGFDEGRVKRILGIPRRLAVALLIPIGYAPPDAAPQKPRRPLATKLHWNRFGAKGS